MEPQRQIEVLSPVGNRCARPVSLSARPAALAGNVIALLDNGKPNAQALLAAVSRALADRFGAAAFVRFSKNEATLGPAGPISPAMHAALTARCSLVVNAVAD